MSIVFKERVCLPENHFEKLSLIFDKGVPEFYNRLSKIDFFTIRYSLKNDKKVNVLVGQPKNIKGKIPAVIYHTGGMPAIDGKAEITLGKIWEFPNSEHFQMLISLMEQYVVFFVRYQDVSSGLQDRMGEEDLETTYELENVLKELGYIDLEKIGMYGSSRGALTILQVLRRIHWVKGAALECGSYDCKQILDSRDEIYRALVSLSFDVSNEEELLKRSPVKWVENLPSDLPMLIFHGEEDIHTPLKQAEDFVNAYKKINKEVIFKKFKDNHNLYKNATEINADILQLYKKIFTENSQSNQ